MQFLPRLPRSVARTAFAELCRSLPPPADTTPQAQDDRDSFAMMAMEALDPLDSAEAMLAIRVVSCEAHARHCLEAAARHLDDPDRADGCRAQAALMGRDAQRALRSLQSLQAARPPAPPPQPAEGEDQVAAPFMPRPAPVEDPRNPTSFSRAEEMWFAMGRQDSYERREMLSRPKKHRDEYETSRLRPSLWS